MTVNKFHIKKISEINKDQLLKFYQKSFHYDKSILDDYDWRYRKGFSSYEPLILLVDNQIRGHAGLIPVDLKVKDKKEKAIWFTDFYIDQKYRQKGYGKLLTEEWMKICPIQITICNDQSLRIFKKLKWESNNRFVRRIKFNNYFNLLPIRKNYEDSNLIKNDLKNLKLVDLNFSTIKKIIEKNDHNLSKKSFCIIRDEGWFRWRLEECPYKKKLYIFEFRNNYFITHLKLKNNYKILNILYSSEEISDDVKNIFNDFLKKNNIDFLAYVSNKPKLSDIFFPWQKKLNFAFYANDKFISNSIDEHFSDIQLIDSDIDYL